MDKSLPSKRTFTFSKESVIIPYSLLSPSIIIVEVLYFIDLSIASINFVSFFTIQASCIKVSLTFAIIKDDNWEVFSLSFNVLILFTKSFKKKSLNFWFLSINSKKVFFSIS